VNSFNPPGINSGTSPDSVEELLSTQDLEVATADLLGRARWDGRRTKPVPFGGGDAATVIVLNV
jgi:hypothetical protein